MKRPPIIAVVGHVDHGKTTLLDAIRKADVAAGEAGGITQSIGAYEIVHSGERMTFIDTPGHEAFMAMRRRGASIADLAIVVVAVDEGVQEQTKEAIAILTETGTPYVVALTKADRGSNLDKAKNDLMQAGVLLEGYGGSTSWQAVSGKTGEGVADLLDLLLLVADTLGLECDPSSPVSGFVLEAKKDAKRGVVVHAVVTDGTLRVGMDIVAGKAGTRVRSLEDGNRARIDSCTASAPVVIGGFKDMPAAGDAFGPGIVAPTPHAARQNRERLVHEEGVTAINIIIKADSHGALEAASQAIRGIARPEGTLVRIVSEGVGDITDGDVQWFVATESERGMVVGFNVSATKPAETMAKTNRIAIVASPIIYDLVRAVEGALKSMTKAGASGDLQVLALFGMKGRGEHVIGGKVVMGEMKNEAVVRVEREGEEIGTGAIASLQSGKKPVESVEEGSECGLMVKSECDIKVGDHIIIR